MMSWYIGWGPKPTRGFQTIHAMDEQMDPPSCHFHFHHSCLKFRDRQISWVSVELQMMSRWNGWGPRPTWNGFHIHSIHVKSVWDHSYAGDEQMDPPSCHFHFHNIFYIFLSRELADFLGNCGVTYDVMVHWVRPLTYTWVWDHSYAVDEQMDPPSCHYHIHRIFCLEFRELVDFP
jgi:hypothetical protein